MGSEWTPDDQAHFETRAVTSGMVDAQVAVLEGPRPTASLVRPCTVGDGVVQFNPSPTYDLSDFTPLEYLGAWYVEMDYTEGYGEIARDFLKKR